jgi:hypothetical protein
MTRLLIAAALVAVAVVIALVVERRRPAPPTQPTYAVPSQLDRDDFARPDAPWLVVVFTSATCDTCAATWEVARQLDSTAVATPEVEVGAEPVLHERYGIDAVPTTVVCDAAGGVVRSFLGPVSATHLWAAVAEAREPGSTPPGCGEG